MEHNCRLIDPNGQRLVFAGNQCIARQFYDGSDSVGDLRGHFHCGRDWFNSLEQASEVVIVSQTLMKNRGLVSVFRFGLARIQSS